MEIKRGVIAFVIMMCVATLAVAQVKLSPAMRSYLSKADGDKVEAIVEINAGAEQALRQSGLTLSTRTGNTVVVSGSPEQLAALPKVPGVKSVKAPSRIYLHCDSSRNVTRTGQVLDGVSLPMGYDGTGVVVGLIDCGVQYSHLSFKDPNGNCRITRVYHPWATATTPIVIDGMTLPGREYTTPEEIAQLTTDDNKQSHGTHTTGIAAGSLVGKYGGMAPGAEIVIAGMPTTQLTDASVAASARYIAHYAHSKGLPCVINMSIGSHDGPHDGTGYLARTFDELNERYGTIFVLSAGNEGSDEIYMTKELVEGDTQLSTVMETFTSNDSDVDIWSRGSSPLTITYKIYNREVDTIVACTRPIAADTIINFSQDPVMSPYISGNVTVTHELNPVNNKYHIYLNHNAVPKYKKYLAFTINGSAGDVIDVWDSSSSAYFSDANLEGYMRGTTVVTVSDIATGHHSISVGAYAGREKYPTNTMNYSTGYKMFDMARFSSYGTDINGVQHPFITSPGVQVVSAVSIYNCSTTTYSQRESTGSGYDYWYVKSGTSMAAPCVTGIVAQWLQACPSLTIDQVKDVMAATAIQRGEMSEKSGPNGNIDAYAGIQMILAKYVKIKGDVNADGVVDIADVNILINIILGNDDPLNYGDRAFVTGRDIVDIADVNATLNIILNIE